MDNIKTTCKCGIKVRNVYKPQENFEYVGCDEKGNPYFKCKSCKSLVWG